MISKLKLFLTKNAINIKFSKQKCKLIKGISLLYKLNLWRTYDFKIRDIYYLECSHRILKYHYNDITNQHYNFIFKYKISEDYLSQNKIR